MKGLERYKKIKDLGGGAQGNVILADDTKLNRKVAIKSLHQTLTSDKLHARRFEEEAKTLAGLRHPSVIDVYDIIANEDGCHLVMEYFEGHSLDQYMKSKIVDCITFFNENYIFDLRYNIIKNDVDFLVVCESLYDHKGNKKELNFNFNKYSNDEKLKYFVLEEPFPKNNNPWTNQAIQREFLLEKLTFVENEDYIFFSDPDEIPNPNLLKNFQLKKKIWDFPTKKF